MRRGPRASNQEELATKLAEAPVIASAYELKLRNIFHATLA
jgi:hypothetical protein